MYGVSAGGVCIGALRRRALSGGIVIQCTSVDVQNGSEVGQFAAEL